MPRGRPRLEENKAYTDRTTLLLYPNDLSQFIDVDHIFEGHSYFFIIIITLGGNAMPFFTFTIVFFLYINLKKMKGEQR